VLVKSLIGYEGAEEKCVEVIKNMKTARRERSAFS
jgi:hypothetical protein